MTSVLSRLQLLSGSKIFVLLMMFSFVSCTKTTNDVFKRPQTVRTDNDSAQERRKAREEKARQERLAKEEANRIRKQKEAEEIAKQKAEQESQTTTQPVEVEDNTDYSNVEIKKNQYKVAVMAPFKNNEGFTSISDDKFLQYFGGMVVASEVLNREGHSLDIRIIDTHGKDINTVLNSELAYGTDVIVGPYEYDRLKATVNFADENDITVVSPWKSTRKINSDKYVQLSPYINEYYISLMKQVAKRHSEGNVYIVGRSDSARDIKMVRGFQRLAQKLWNTSNATPLNELLITESQLNGENPVFLPAMQRNRKTVFIIPNLRGSDDNYVYNVLRRISLEKSLNRVEVFGMFRILDNPRVDFELYNTLDLKIASAKYIDVDDVNVKNFRRIFFEKFGVLPEKDAYRGYDNFIWLGNALTKHGVNFRYNTNGAVDRDFLQESYDIRPIKGSNDYNSTPKYFENSAIDLIEFKDGRFVRSK